MVRVQDKISLNLQTFLQILKITFSEKKMKTDSQIISKHKDDVFQRVKHLKKYIRRAHHSFQS